MQVYHPSLCDIWILGNCRVDDTLVEDEVVTMEIWEESLLIVNPLEDTQVILIISVPSTSQLIKVLEFWIAVVLVGWVAKANRTKEMKIEQ